MPPKRMPVVALALGLLVVPAPLQARGSDGGDDPEVHRMAASVRVTPAPVATRSERTDEAPRPARPPAPRTATPAPPTPAPPPPPVPPSPPPSKADIAVLFAHAQVGKPYRTAGTGPDAFDCSGLTLAAWGAAGVALPHYSGAQFAQLPGVPLDQLQPGDLVFDVPQGRGHVAMYVGNGMQIAATHSGSTVKLQPLPDKLYGAVRPG